MNKTTETIVAVVKKYLVFLLFFLIPFYVKSHSLGIEFSVFNSGLEIKTCLTILQDSNGFMWFGNQIGLTRYDGYEYKTYNNIPFDETSISGNAIHSLLEDSSGNFWVGTAEDLCLFDREREIFTHYKNDPDDPLSIPEGRIFSLFEDSKGVLWIGTDKGFSIYDNVRDNFKLILSDPGTASHFLADNYPIYEDSSGTIWLGTTQGLYKLLNRNEYEFELIKHNSGTNEITSITGDKSGNLWLGTWGDGFFKLDTGSMVFSSIIPDNLKVTSLMTNNNGGLLIGIHEEGVLNYDPLKDEFTPFIYNPDISTTNRTSCIYKDNAGILWFGFFGFGAIRFDPHVRKLFSIEFDEWVTGLTEDNNGLLWISGEQNGLYTFDRDTEVLTSLGELPETPEIFSYPSYDVIKDSKGYVWFSTVSHGLHCINPVTKEIVKSFYQVSHNEDGLNTNNTADIIEGENGILWISTTDGGLNKYDPKTGEFSYFRNKPDDLNSLSYDDIWSIFEDSRGNLWLGTTRGLDRLDRGSDNFLHFPHDPESSGSISSNWVLSIFEDDSEDIWFATAGGGLNKYDYDTGLFSYYMKTEGLSGNVPSAILEDNAGNLWIGTIDGGVSKFDPLKETFVNYTAEDGLLGPVNGGRCEYTSRDGTMFMGSNKGFIYFDPQKITADANNPDVVLTSFNVFEKEKNLEKLITYYNEIHISFKESFFSFGFSALEFAKPEKLQFAYKLEGWDEDWNHSGNRRYASYTNLPGGNYIFLVKVTNSDGYWVPEENYARLQIHISTHPLKSLWAISLYITLGLSIILILFVIYRRRQEEKLAIQMQEVKRERNAKEKLQRVDNLKDEFLANTTHELRTPLNGIIGIAESLIEDSSAAVSKGTKKELSLIASSGRRLTYLINDILDLSRLKEGDIQIEKNSVDLSKLVNTVLVLSKPLCMGKPLELRNKVPEDLPLLEGDINRIQQILHNLVGNAIKFTNEGSVSITAREITGTPEHSAMIEISVNDTGIGIPKDKIDEIWLSFRQIDASSSRDFGGTGLGLPITKRLVEIQGGSIWLKSSMGRGSSFTFTLPISGESVTADYTTGFSSPGETFTYEAQGFNEETHNSLSSIILFVDDDPINRHVVELQLSGAGYSFKLVSSGEEAISYIEKVKPDLVLLDIMMPKMDGYELCRKIRRLYSANDLPVIMVTAKNQVADLVEGLSSGANDYISKPYSKEELFSRIRRHLDVSRTHISFGRFVPKDLLALLNKGNADKLKPGDHIEKEMILLLTDFASDPLKKQSETFSFLTSFLPMVLPVIRASGGIIHRYEGEGVMSFFPDSSKALEASIEIQKLVDQYNIDNQLKEQKSIKVCTVIHVGSLLIGTAGDDVFTDEMVISAAVKQTSYLRDLAQKLECPILASEQIIEGGEGHFEKRLISKRMLNAYEILSPVTKGGDLKIKSRNNFEEGIRFFNKFQFDEASVEFGKSIKINPGDRAALHYRERCVYYMKNPPDDEMVSLI